MTKRAFWLAVVACVVASCGIDVVGTEPANVAPQPCVFDNDASHFDPPACTFAP